MDEKPVPSVRHLTISEFRPRRHNQATRTAMDLVRAGQIVGIMLSPTLAVAAVLYLPRAVRAAWRLAGRRPGRSEPDGRPIEALAADLGRLLRMHDALARSSGLPRRAQRLHALEAAITDCAADAARALDVPVPVRPVHAGLPPPELSRLLRNLADAGLTLPSTVDLLANDRRR
jgi:hypothetical protein